MACSCDPEKIAAVHAYLAERFPGYAVEDFHAPTRLMQAGLPGPHIEHHVVRLTTAGVLPYHAVLLNDFLQYSAADIAARLQRWSLADTLRARRIAVVSREGASGL